MYERIGKRLLDIVLGTAAVILTAPLLLLCAIAIRVDSQGSILFRQKRVGRFGRVFNLYKLRTMYHSESDSGTKVTTSNDERITRVGHWLRRMKFDELPQFYNVVRGDMSIVGPRPEVPEYVAVYEREFAQLLTLRPGITSTASLHFLDEEWLLAQQEDAESFYISVVLPEKLEQERHYYSSLTLAEDIRTIVSTAARVIWRNRIQTIGSGPRRHNGKVQSGAPHVRPRSG